jgi:hypothetical protein
VPLLGQGNPALRGAFQDPGASAVAGDGTFAIKGIFGRARLQVLLPDEWMVKAIVHAGRDITDTPLELKGGEVLSDVEVLLTDRVTTVAGAVLDDRNRPVGDATVLVFSTDRARWSDDLRGVRAVRPDQTGQFEVKGLPPGGYVAVALPYVETGLWNDPEYLESVLPFGQEVTIAEAGQHTLTLSLVSQ